MPFQAILKDLVSSVDGAEGAIFLDIDGEAVQWYAKGDAERLKLRAAYTAVIVQSCQAVSKNTDLGRMLHLIIEYEGARLLVGEVENGYFVVLELSTTANLGQALYRMQPAIARLRHAVAA